MDLANNLSHLIETYKLQDLVHKVRTSKVFVIQMLNRRHKKVKALMVLICRCHPDANFGSPSPEQSQGAQTGSPGAGFDHHGICVARRRTCTCSGKRFQNSKMKADVVI